MDRKVRIILGVEYDGSAFFGWQWQEGGLRTVQDAVQKAASKVANHLVTVICTGRTDTGVHALEQVVHFDTQAVRSLRSWQMGINAMHAIAPLLDFIVILFLIVPPGQHYNVTV